MRRKAAWLSLSVTALGLGSALWLLPRYLRAASILSQSAGLEDPSGLTRRVRGAVRTQRFELPTDDRPVEIMAYEPADRAPRGALLLVHGIHPNGIEEPRLVGLARAFAAVGYRVWTPSYPELAALSANAQTVARMRFTAEQLAADVGEPVIGMGISVGGGLLLIAAASPTVTPALRRVVTVGAHHDLARVARHYAGEIARDVDGRPTEVAPHPYGLWVLAHAHVERLFAAGDVSAARSVMGAWIDQDAGRDTTARPEDLSPAGQALLRDLRAAPVGDALRARLLSAIEDAGPELAAVSPVGQLSGLRAETLLLHGTDDSVVPPTELSWLLSELPPGVRRRALVTPVLSHAEFPEGTPLREYLSLLHFVAAIIR